MPKQVTLPDPTAAALDLTPEARAHGRNYAAACSIARDLGLPAPEPPNVRRARAGRENAAKGGHAKAAKNA